METVVSCTKLREKQGNNGQTAIIYAIGLSDGRGGESFNKEIPIGTPVEQLEITDSQWGLRIKMKDQGGQRSGGGGGGWNKGGGGADKGGVEVFAMAYAKDLVIADKIKIDALLGAAEKMYVWMKSKRPTPAPAAAPATPAPAAARPAAPAPQQQQAPAPQMQWGPPAGADDLPF